MLSSVGIGSKQFTTAVFRSIGIAALSQRNDPDFVLRPLIGCEVSVSVSVCLFVCPLARIFHNRHVQSSFFCTHVSD